MTSLEMTRKIVSVLDSKKAVDIKTIDIQDLSILSDYFVVCSGTSSTQVKALADEVEDQLAALGIEPKRVEGYQTATWILLDYYEVIVHIFFTETRDFYQLERLWADGKQLDLDELLKKHNEQN
ncbi:ribosome silencing factor [Candidatus Soleaferrea massiliensis]|uniref:ribosome silencing factor n=1 Tax=Candidatus Soleaferrea massiliensis TaxID=1470354 RepID=UPI00058EBA49|nr:ribosome silencing factor [Candidatus Soleaferrea massiliensis]